MKHPQKTKEDIKQMKTVISSIVGFRGIPANRVTDKILDTPKNIAAEIQK